MIEELSVLVVGGGSIGTRHLRNLRGLGVIRLLLADPDEGRTVPLAHELGVTGYSEIEHALGAHPDAAVIATPSHLHLEQAQVFVDAGIPVFVEKPLSISELDLRKLAERVRQQNLVTLVGCNMRFHPLVAKAHSLLRDGAIGRLRFGRYHVGSYLPEWRPGTDFRASYSANPTHGGGVILDSIHEIDLATWFQGPVKDVTAAAGSIALQLPVEDYAVLVNQHRDGSWSDIEMDYLQRSYERGLRLVGDHGSIHWDYRDKKLKLYETKHDHWIVFEEEDGYDWNRMYIDEMRHFLEAVENNGPTTLSIPDAVHTTTLALRAKQAAAAGVRKHLENA